MYLITFLSPILLFNFFNFIFFFNTKENDNGGPPSKKQKTHDDNESGMEPSPGVYQANCDALLEMVQNCGITAKMKRARG